MPQSRVQTSLTLFGSAPWGFRISGGKEFNQPIVITRVTPGSLASKSGIQSGDVLIAINNQYVSQMTQDECEVAVKQAVGSLHLVLEKNAATVTELPGGQFKVDGDRSIYTSIKDQQQRLSKFNRSAKPFGAPDTPATTEKAADKPADTKSGFRSVAFKPKPPTQPSPTDSGQDQPETVSSATQSMSKVTLGATDSQTSTTPTTAHNPNKYNRKITPFPGATSTNSNENNNAVAPLAQDDLPPPPDFILSANNIETGPPVKHSSSASIVMNQPKSIISRKVIASQSLGLYSQSNVGDVYESRVGGQ